MSHWLTENTENNGRMVAETIGGKKSGATFAMRSGTRSGRRPRLKPKLPHSKTP
ncbi:hypothetical protein [Streptomyces varsoviensis]|uniref:hypothetical protein n=1 Tax=Streptomyces varsoviensis TaxID=67373 RepID=UPI000ACEE307|nr:hypothetical protein [Streptomyces varsoviensis]